MAVNEVNPPLRIVMVNGLTFPYILGLALLGREVYALGAYFPFRPTRSFLQRAYDWFCRRGIITNVFDGIEELRRYRDILAYQDRVGIFRKCEAAMNRRFRFDEIDRKLPEEYAMAYKVTGCNHFRRKALLPFVLRHINILAPPTPIKVTGVERDVLFIYRAYYGEDPRFPVTPMRDFRRLFNLAQWPMFWLYALAWTMRRFRLKTPEPKEAFLGTDYTSWWEPVGQRLVREILDPGHEVVYVSREPDDDPHIRQLEDGSAHCWAGDGGLGPWDALKALAEVTRDILRLGAHSLHLAPDMFTSVMMLPCRKMTFRVLAKNNRFRYFLARDDYSNEHPLRTHELRKTGCRSLGIQRSITIDNTIEPSNRYIDFDIYYVFGIGMYRDYHHATWSRRMTVRAIGAWGCDRAQLARLDLPRPPDMIYFGRGGEREVQTIRAFFQMAEHFPERRFYVKQKPGGRDRYTPDILALLDNPPPNVVTVDPLGNTYELFLHARYALASGSTSIAEAIRYGLIAFYHDIYPESDFYSRRFPELNVRSAEEMIARIEAYEAGEATYPREKFNDLMELSVADPFDLIREDMGLPPKGLPAPQPVANPFLPEGGSP